MSLGPPPRPLPIAAWPVGHPLEQRLAIGVSTQALADNSWRAWRPGQLAEVNRFEHAARAHAAIVMYFADWQHVPSPDLAQLRMIAQRGSTPEISWEPWDSSRPLRAPQARYTLASIVDGSHDAYIRRWALALRRYGHPVLLRFAQEMNGSWYPWSESSNGNHPGEYVAAWRHVHDLFTAVGATNVRWVWSPVARFGVSPAGLSRDYPGDAYVDVLGLSGFNGGTTLDWTGWHGFGTLFDSYIEAEHRLAPVKPLQISEVGTAAAGGSQAGWIGAMFHDLRARPYVTSLVWFDVAKQTDWRLDSAPQAAHAFANGLHALEAPPLRAAAGDATMPDLNIKAIAPLSRTAPFATRASGQ